MNQMKEQRNSGVQRQLVYPHATCPKLFDQVRKFWTLWHSWAHEKTHAPLFGGAEFEHIGNDLSIWKYCSKTQSSSYLHSSCDTDACPLVYALIDTLVGTAGTIIYPLLLMCSVIVQWILLVPLRKDTQGHCSCPVPVFNSCPPLPSSHLPPSLTPQQWHFPAIKTR